MILIKNGHVFINNTFEFLDILIENKKIIRIEKDIEITEDCSIVIDAKNQLVTPGFIDLHIHLREPGFTHKETIKTGTEAAARGGFTTVAAMPNTNPVPDNEASVTHIQDIIEKDALVKVIPYSSITKGEMGLELVDFNSLANLNVIGFSDDGKGVQSEEMMKKAMICANRVNKKIVAHCEDERLTNKGFIHEGKLSKQLGIKGIPSCSEYEQIKRDIRLVEETGCAYHICHISTRESVELVRCAKAKGLRVSCEVTPHHLLLCDEDIDIRNANFKMNPPLRSKEDQIALIEGLKDGTIDIIATDHAPHHHDEKAKDFKDAPFGIIGLETCFPLLYTYLVLNKKISLERLIQLLTVEPARLFDLDIGVLEVGKDADITIIDLNKQIKISTKQLKSMGKNTPFLGYIVKGQTKMTFVQGKLVYKEDE